MQLIFLPLSITYSRKSEIYQSAGGHLPLMSSRKNNHSWLPHIYVILIGVSLGGALMFSLIFIGAYYYISLRNTFPATAPSPHENKTKFFHQDEEVDVSAARASTPPFPPQAHSSPKGGGRDSEKVQRSSSEKCSGENEGTFMSATSKFFAKYRSKSADRINTGRATADTQHKQLQGHKSSREHKKSSSTNGSSRSSSRRSKRDLDASSEIEIDINSLR